MRIVSVENFKGGVGKTTTAINLAYELAEEFNKRVLIVDNDPQGHVSKFFDRHSYDRPSMADLLTKRNFKTKSANSSTIFKNIDILPANMRLFGANKELLLDTTRVQQTILKKALEQVAVDYDYCIIDNQTGPDINVINALVASQDVIIPVRVDKYTFDGMEELVAQIEEIKEMNTELTLRGCLLTQFAKSRIHREGAEYLVESGLYPVFKARISRTVKFEENSFSGKPIRLYAKRCNAAQDYKDFAKEYLESIGAL